MTFLGNLILDGDTLSFTKYVSDKIHASKMENKLTLIFRYLSIGEGVALACFFDATADLDDTAIFRFPYPAVGVGPHDTS